MHFVKIKIDLAKPFLQQKIRKTVVLIMLF